MSSEAETSTTSDLLSARTRFAFIKESYGHAVYRMYLNYEKNTIKYVHCSSDLNYLYECKFNNLIPKFLQFKVANPALLNTRAYFKCQNILLREEINSKKKCIKYLSATLTNIYDELVNIFPPDKMVEINQIIDEIQFKEDNAKYRTHCKKFQKLIYERFTKQQRNRNRARSNAFLTRELMGMSEPEENGAKLVWNFSNRTLTDEEIRVLENGMSFNRLSSVSHAKVMSNVEYLFHHASGVQKELIDFKKWDEDPDNNSNKELRILEPRQLSLAADLKSATERFFQRAQLSLTTKRAANANERNDEDLLSNLSKDTSIVITRPDKGRGVVVLDRSDYNRKLEQILSDTKKFKVLNKDPTISRENSLTNLLREMKKEEYLTRKEYWYIKPVGSLPARLYGLPKVHKDGAPLRPIVSCVKSYNYQLGKFLSEIIKPIRDGPFTLKNNSKFLEFLKQNSHLANGNKMSSFDIESLFTNIPVQETTEIICNKLYYTNPKLIPFIPEGYFRQLLKFATECTHFLFNKKYYDQCDGVSMGTPLAAIFAEIFMTHFEETFLPDLLNNNATKLLAWRRYVDDTFTIFSNDGNQEEFRELLNTFHPSIKFTVEAEVDSSIPFLDVYVTRRSDGFDTTVYRKKTTTRLMLKWHSLVPKSYKKSSVSALVHRAIRTCSTYHSLHKELITIRHMAYFNGYPSTFVQNIIQQQLNKLYALDIANDQVPQASAENQTYRYIEIPYVGAPSLIFAKELKSTIRTHEPNADLRVIYQTTNTTKRFFPTKDRLEMSQQSGLVYKISCLDCTGAYIGKTIRQTTRRIAEHEKDVAKATLYITQQLHHTQPHPTLKPKKNQILRGRIQKPIPTTPLRRSNRLLQKRHRTQPTKQSTPNEIVHYKPNSALGKHVKNTGHSINFTEIKKLTEDSRSQRLLIKESIEIRSHKPQLNGTDTSVPLYVFPEGHRKPIRSLHPRP